MAKYFGTDGIRGKYGDSLINPDFAFRFGFVLGLYLRRERGKLPLNAVIGRDTRNSSSALCGAIIRGLNQHDIHVHDAGVVPTPAIARAVLSQDAVIGIVVTASHNPVSDNGFKIFNRQGCKYDKSSELEIEALLDSEQIPSQKILRSKSFPLGVEASYINYMRSLMHQDCLKDWKIVLDLANGATYRTTPAAFSRWGAELHLIGDNPDGENINEGVGSEHPQQLGMKVREVGARIGIAHDGDGDRLVVCDDNGELLEGEELLGLFGIHALRSDALSNRTLVTTVHSNLGLDHAIQKAGGRVERVEVGDRNVARCMRQIGANIGGESSGHIIFSDLASTGDGLLAAIKLIDLLCFIDEPLSTARKQVTLFPQKTININVAQKLPIDQLQNLSRAIHEAGEYFGENGRVLVRYSGTEAKLRLLVEGRDEHAIVKHMEAIEAAARTDLEIIDS